MSRTSIPLRPSNFTSSLRVDEMNALTWLVISGCPRKDAFTTFVRPDMVGSKAKAAVDDYIKQFFARKEVRDYLDAYQKTLDAFLNPTPVKKEPKGSLEERKAKAKTKLVEFAMNLADDIENAQDPEFVLKMADKAGLLDSDEEVEELPRRYLPVTCSECAYRKFVEENCEVVNDGTELASDDDTV